MQRKAINIFCSHYPPHLGGIERYAELQAKELVKLGFCVNIITNDTERLGFLEQHEHISIYRLRFFGFIANRLPFPWDIRQFVKVYKSCFRTNSVLTIVHGRYYALSVIGCIMARLGGTKLVLIDHSSDYIRMSSPIFNTAAKVYEHTLTALLMLFKPQVFGVAAACNEWLERFRIKASGVCYNGLDLDFKEAPLSDIKQTYNTQGRRVVLAVGRLVREKGIGELVRCFERSTELQSRYVLIVIGSGELASEIEVVAQSNSSVFFLGRQPPATVLAYMSQADVFVNPSNYPEGLPTILLEAGRYGLTVITTPNGGALEVVQHKKTGIVIQAGYAKEIEKALLDLLDDVNHGKHLGNELQKHIFARFSFRDITRKFILDDLRIQPS